MSELRFESEALTERKGTSCGRVSNHQWRSSFGVRRDSDKGDEAEASAYLVVNLADQSLLCRLRKHRRVVHSGNVVIVFSLELLEGPRVVAREVLHLGAWYSSHRQAVCEASGAEKERAESKTSQKVLYD